MSRWICSPIMLPLRLVENKSKQNWIGSEKMQEVMLTIKKMVPIRTMNYRRIDRTVAGHIRPIRYICTLSL